MSVEMQSMYTVVWSKLDSRKVNESYRIISLVHSPNNGLLKLTAESSVVGTLQSLILNWLDLQ